MNKLISFGAVLAIIALGFWYFFTHPSLSAPVAPEPIAKAQYQCDAGKTIEAAFYQGDEKLTADPKQPPTPGGSVQIVLSDGRAMTLPQTISADGARYSDGDPSVDGSETFVFWSKGKSALVLENGEQKSFTGCIEVVSDPGGLPQVYESSTNGFSLRYPSGYTLDDAYKYQALGPGKEIAGVKFTISPAIAAGTNLSADSYLSVEQLPQTQNCAASLFLDARAKAINITDGGEEYSVASSTGAGAGNRYEETVYALPGTTPCMAVRYFVHYGAIENYPTGSVKEFDKQALLDQFDAIRRTFTIGR